MLKNNEKMHLINSYCKLQAIDNASLSLNFTGMFSFPVVLGSESSLSCIGMGGFSHIRADSPWKMCFS